MTTQENIEEYIRKGRELLTKSKIHSLTPDRWERAVRIAHQEFVFLHGRHPDVEARELQDYIKTHMANK